MVSNPWQLYDALIDQIDDNILVRGNKSEGQWTRVATDDGALGVAYSMSSLPGRTPEALTLAYKGKPLKDVAALAKSWDFAEASVGMAAINAYYSHPQRAEANGFHRATDNVSFPDFLRSYNDRVAGKRIAFIGHFPFAPEALNQAADLVMLERNVQEGDLPDSAAEYVLADRDFVFISGSSFVNKTAPRLIELTRDVYSIMLGPSTPLSPLLMELGVNEVTGLVTFEPEPMCNTLGQPGFPEMFVHGGRYTNL